MAIIWEKFYSQPGNTAVTIVLLFQRRRAAGNQELLYAQLNRHLGTTELDLKFRYAPTLPEAELIGTSQKAGVLLWHPEFIFGAGEERNPTTLCTRSLFRDGWFWQGGFPPFPPFPWCVVVWRPNSTVPYRAISPPVNWTELPITSSAPACGPA